MLLVVPVYVPVVPTYVLVAKLAGKPSLFLRGTERPVEVWWTLVSIGMEVAA